MSHCQNRSFTHCQITGRSELYKQTSFQSVFTLFESTKHPIQKQMQESIVKLVLKSKTQQLLILMHNFAKSETVSSDHDLETGASPPLFRHSDVTAHLITEQITVMDDPGFRMSAKIT